FCLIYLRDGIDVVSRPILAQISGLVLNSECRLISALSVPDHEERQRTIADALTAIAGGQGHRAEITLLRDSIGNRNGLPASAFDALKLLPANEKTLTYLLINARDAEERNAVWSLQNELPFLWLALPLSAWGATMETLCHQLADALKS